jgi:uncharacterized Tic20 family protein
MDPMADKQPERGLHPREREIVALVYLLAIFPLFGLLAAGIIALLYQERSRTVVFHAKQAFAGQAFMLLLVVVIFMFSLFALLVGVLSPRLRDLFLFFDRWILYLTFLVNAVWCAYFAWMSLEGRDLEYPLIGVRLRDRSEVKDQF